MSPQDDEIAAITAPIQDAITVSRADLHKVLAWLMRPLTINNGADADRYIDVLVGRAHPRAAEVDK